MSRVRPRRSAFDDPALRRSQELAFEAERMPRPTPAGYGSEARALLARAARIEERVVGSVAPDKPRTFGLLAASAVALWMKAHEFKHAKRLGEKLLLDSRLSGGARRRIEDILEMIGLRSSIRTRPT